MERDLIIDKTIATPLYIQVANSLREKILTGKYQEGYRFPTEPEFAAMLGINHQTLRKSFQILSEQNLITQQRGKGTFVTCNTDRLYKIAVTWGKSKSNAVEQHHEEDPSERRHSFFRLMFHYPR